MVAPYRTDMVPNAAPRSMRSTIAAVDALATPSVPTQEAATHRLPGTVGFTIGFAGGIFTAAAIAASGWLTVYLTMQWGSPWGAAMVVLALIYVALLLVDWMFPPGRVTAGQSAPSSGP